MHSIAILGFFTLIVVFFFTGRNDFGLKPTQIQNDSSFKDESINSEELSS